MENFSLKELYDVVLKATYKMKVGTTEFEEGETVVSFDRIQIANFQEIVKSATAHGGWDDRTHIIWESIKEIRLQLAQGVVSKKQFALMSNAKMFESNKEDKIILTQREFLETNENGEVELKYTPLLTEWIFVKDTDNNKLYFSVDDKKIKIPDAYKEILVEYKFEYDNGFNGVVLGQPFMEGFLSLEGRTRVKDDKDGHTKTGIIKIPKLKLMSDLSITLGENANPFVGRLLATGYPVGVKGESKVMEITFLNDDIDSDM